MQLLPKNPLKISAQFRVGRGVKTLYTNDSGHLIVEMTDGQTIDLGALEATVTSESVEKALGYLPAKPGDFVPESGGTFTGDVSFGGQIAFTPSAAGKSAPYLEGRTGQDGTPVLHILGSEADEAVLIRGVEAPEGSADAANKGYVDRAAKQLGLTSGAVGKVPKIKELNEDGSVKEWELGDGGEDGAPGIVISATEPADEAHPVWLNPEGSADAEPWIPAPAMAAVGQTIKVKAVDSSGRPTAWEAADFPSGGGGGGETWELIRYIKVPEGAAEANELTINTDENGNAFALKRAKLFSVFPEYTGETKIQNFSFFKLNGATTGSNSPYCYTSGFVAPSGTVRRICSIEVDLSKPGLQVEFVTRNYGPTGVDYFGPARIAEITSIGGANMLIYPGCEFWLYGVRA